MASRTSSLFFCFHELLPVALAVYNAFDELGTKVEVGLVKRIDDDAAATHLPQHGHNILKRDNHRFGLLIFGQDNLGLVQ